MIPAWGAYVVFVAGVAVWLILYVLYKTEKLESKMKNWLKQHGWSVSDRSPPDPMDMFHLIIKTEFGYLIEVSQEKGNEFLGIQGAVTVSPPDKAKLAKMASPDLKKFYYTLKTEMAKGAYDWDTKPRIENPDDILVFVKSSPESVATKGDFIRAVEKVINGMSLVIGYLRKELGTV